MNLIFYMKLLIIIITSQISDEYDRMKKLEDATNMQWFPAIFRRPDQSTQEIYYEFKCLGVHVHPQAVLASATCVPVGMKDVTFVRFYDWVNNEKKISRNTEYQQRALSKVVAYRNLHPGEVGTNYVNVLELSQSIHRQPAVVFQPMASYNYERNIEWVKSIEKTCIFVTTIGDFDDETTIEHVPLGYKKKSDCCKELNVSIDDIDWQWKEYIHTSTCGVRLFGRACFYNSAHSFKYPDPSICIDYEDQLYLQGFVVKIGYYIIEFSNFDESISWIKEYLKSLP